MSIREFRYGQDALEYATEIYGAVFFKELRGTFEDAYLVPETTDELEQLYAEGLDLATGYENNWYRPIREEDA